MRQTKQLTPYEFMTLLGPVIFSRLLSWMDQREEDKVTFITPYYNGIIAATILTTCENHIIIRDNARPICEYIKARCLNLKHPNYQFLNGFIVGAKEHLGIVLDNDIPLLREVATND